MVMAAPRAMSDGLDWPFFEPQHRAFAAELDAWAGANLGHAHGHERAEVDATCRSLVR
jgi:acyl-CoA dehydrogenase